MGGEVETRAPSVSIDRIFRILLSRAKARSRSYCNAQSHRASSFAGLDGEYVVALPSKNSQRLGGAVRVFKDDATAIAPNAQHVVIDCQRSAHDFCQALGVALILQTLESLTDSGGDG